MAKLVVSVGLGKGTWSQVVFLIENEDWEEIFVVADSRSAELFKCKKEFKTILIDSTLSLTKLTETIMFKLQGRIGFGDVGVNFISGIGKEHMAILSALLKLGGGIRPVFWNGETVVNY